MAQQSQHENRKGRLEMNDYVLAASLTQIVSIDLLIKNENGKYLLGMRKNPPALGTLFVPGGRVYKGENLRDARSRITQAELGCNLENVEFQGIYDHYYANENPGGGAGIDTHYVSIAFTADLPGEVDSEQFAKQHDESCWLSKDELIGDERVHYFTKCFFSRLAGNRFV